MKEELKEFIEYIKPYLYTACEGKFSGHNFNSYFPKDLKDKIPMYFRDLVSTSIHQIAIKSQPKNIRRKDGTEYISQNHMSQWYFDFLNDETLKSHPGGCEPYYMSWILYEAIKCLELYLNK